MAEASITLKDQELGVDVHVNLNIEEKEVMYSELKTSQKAVYAIGKLLDAVPGPDMILHLCDAVRDNDVYKFTKVILAKEEMLSQLNKTNEHSRNPEEENGMEEKQ